MQVELQSAVSTDLINQHLATLYKVFNGEKTVEYSKDGKPPLSYQDAVKLREDAELLCKGMLQITFLF